MLLIVILELLNDDDKKFVEKNFMKVVILMNEMNNVDVMSFFDFLKELEMDFYIYLLVVRLLLCSFKIFFKRLFCEIRVNNYNIIVLKCWEVNMDI